jgi:hypothetical protein
VQVLGDFDRQRFLAALLLLVVALFVFAGTPFAARWRRQLRLAVIVGFIVAFAVALLEIVLWLI